MEPTGLKHNIPRAKSFRQEGYNNRRTFLRSYPLHWGGEDDKSKEEGKTVQKVTKESGEGKKPLKKIIISVFNWGEKRILIFRSYKDKVIIYVISCLPVGFKPPAMISSR